MTIKQSTSFSAIMLMYCFLNAQTDSSMDSVWKNITLENIVVTAQYAPTDSKNAVHQIKVIKAADIQKQGFNNLAEVLSTQINLRVTTDPILGNGLKIQGIGGENIQVLIDGVPVIGRVNGNIDLSQINLQNIARIEIIEGAMSAQYGSNASGGVINLITKKSQLHRFRIQSQNQIEDIGILNNSLTLATQFGQLYASITGSRINTQIENKDSLRLIKTIELPSGQTYSTKKNPWNPKLQYGLDGMIRYRHSDSFNIVYQYRFFDEKVSDFGKIRRPQFKPYAFDDFYKTKRQDHSLNLEMYFGENIYFNSTTAFNQYQREKEAVIYDFEADSTSLIENGQDTTIFNSFLHRSIFSTTSSRQLNGQLGIEIHHETGSGKRIMDTTSTNPHQSFLTNYAAWASLRYQPNKKITLQTNLRYGYNSKYHHPIIPSFLLDWKPQKNWNFKLSYAHGFRAPSLKELYFSLVDINHNLKGNTELDAETSKNISLFAEYQKSFLGKHDFTFSGKLFYNTIQNRIILAEVMGTEFQYQNLDNFETHGLNLSLRYQLDDNFMVLFGNSYTRLFNFWSTDYDANKYINLAEFQNELSYKLPKIKTQLVITHRYIGRQIRFYQTATGDLKKGFIGDYHLVNATVSRDFWKKRIFVSLGAKNIFDTQTVPFTGENNEVHSGGDGRSQLLNWGRSLFLKVNFSIY